MMLKKKKQVETVGIRKFQKLEQNHKRLLLNFSIIAVCYFVLVLCCVTLFITSYNLTHIKTSGMPQIHYQNLSDDEINRTQAILSQVKPEYLYAAKSITFTKNMTATSGLYDADRLWLGLTNERTHTIYVKYSEDQYEYELTICHELIHLILRHTELFAYDISDYRVCYKDPKHQGIEQWHSVEEKYK